MSSVTLMYCSDQCSVTFRISMFSNVRQEPRLGGALPASCWGSQAQSNVVAAVVVISQPVGVGRVQVEGLRL